MILSFYLLNLICSWLQCEMSDKPPFIKTSNANTKEFLSIFRRKSSRQNYDHTDGPIAYTKLGPVLGNKMDIGKGREIFAFTGVPYGESPTGDLRFRSPVMRRPWNGIWKATSPSPFCIQANAVTMMMLRGREDCLYLDIYTPQLPTSSRNARLPVLIWIPAGANVFGRSDTYGPAYLLQEDIIVVVINMRVGILGYLATGDEASPGNYGLKDQSLAVTWVYENIHAFNGDRNKIVIGGTSSGAYAAHSMLFTNHDSKNYISGIYAMSGSTLANHGLDAAGRAQNASDAVAKTAGCPTAAEGRSLEMVECMRKIDPYLLAAYQTTPYATMPPLAHMLGPTIEPDVPDAYISELPETLYKEGRVPPIPLISRDYCDF